MTISASGLGTAFLLGTAAVLPTNGFSAFAQTNSTVPQAFNAPDGALVLTRELHRELAGGKQLVTRRNYRITFTRMNDGWRVDGQLIDSQVDAPPELGMLAELEKARADVGLFPLYLDTAGQIVEQHGSGDPALSAKARGIVGGAVSGSTMGPQDKAVAGDMVRRIAAQSQSAGGKWPADLFHPAEGHRSESRDMALPDGSEGRITVTIEAAGNGKGVLDHFERNVVTELAGTKRESREIFRLALSR